jgi:hypothetical protein
LRGWLRQGNGLAEIEAIQGWVSPLTGVRMGLEGVNLALYYPPGRRFVSFLEAQQECEAAQAQVIRERQERQAAQARAERLAARLRALGIDPEGDDS